MNTHQAVSVPPGRDLCPGLAYRWGIEDVCAVSSVTASLCGLSWDKNHMRVAQAGEICQENSAPGRGARACVTIVRDSDRVRPGSPGRWSRPLYASPGSPHAPGGVDGRFDLAGLARFQVIGTDHRSRAASAGLDLLDHQRIGPFVLELENMGGPGALLDLAQIVPELLHDQSRSEDLLACRSDRLPAEERLSGKRGVYFSWFRLSGSQPQFLLIDHAHQFFARNKPFLDEEARQGIDPYLRIQQRLLRRLLTGKQRVRGIGLLDAWAC